MLRKAAIPTSTAATPTAVSEALDSRMTVVPEELLTVRALDQI